MRASKEVDGMWNEQMREWELEEPRDKWGEARGMRRGPAMRQRLYLSFFGGTLSGAEPKVCK